jgi:hypothetical protein
VLEVEDVGESELDSRVVVDAVFDRDADDAESLSLKLNEAAAVIEIEHVEIAKWLFVADFEAVEERDGNTVAVDESLTVLLVLAGCEAVLVLANEVRLLEALLEWVPVALEVQEWVIDIVSDNLDEKVVETDSDTVLVMRIVKLAAAEAGVVELGVRELLLVPDRDLELVILDTEVL